MPEVNTARRKKRCFVLLMFASASAAYFSLIPAARSAETAMFGFLKIPSSPRNIALGSLNSFWEPDPLSTAQNPSMGVLAEGRRLSVAGAGRFDGAAAEASAALVAAKPPSAAAARGFYANMLTSSHERIAAPSSADSYLFTEQGTFATYSVAAGGFYSAHVQDATYFGISLKLIAEKLYSETYSGAAADLAVLEIVDPSSMFSLGVRNAGVGFSGGYSLPLSAYLSILGRARGVSFGIEAEYDIQGFGDAKIGAEIPLSSNFDFRAGFRHPFKDHDTGNFFLSRFSTGFGIKLSAFELDYAWQSLGDLGSSHVAAVRMKI